MTCEHCPCGLDRPPNKVYCRALETTKPVSSECELTPEDAERLFRRWRKRAADAMDEYKEARGVEYMLAMMMRKLG